MVHPNCKTCAHPERERIELELALSPNVREVAQRYGMATRSLSRHKTEHVPPEKLERLRGMTPAQAELDIEELTRRGGEQAMIGFARLVQECRDQAERCDAMGLFSEGAKYRKLQLDAYKEQAKIAAIYPGGRTINNTLMIGDASTVFEMTRRILERSGDIQTARLQLAEEYLAMASERPALEHAA